MHCRAIVCAVLLAGIAAAQVALAVDWVELGSTRGGSLYMDADSLREERGYVRAWVREDLTTAQRDETTGRSYVRAIISFALDCEGRRYAITASSRRATGGEEVSSFDVPRESWEFVEAVPGSVAELVLQAACRIHDARAGDAAMLASLTDPQAWELLGSGEHQGNPTQLFIMGDSIGHQGEVGWAVLQVRFARPQGFEGLPPAKYLLTRELVNCRSGQRAVAGVMLVGARGETIVPFHDESRLDPRQVEFGSPAADVFFRICGGRRF